MRHLSSITSLFQSSRPSAIIRRIGAVVIDPLDCHARWSRAHIGNENLKVAPPLTDGNAAAPVGRIVFIARVAASLLHRLPYMPQSCISHSMLSRAQGGKHIPQAPTASANSRSDRANPSKVNIAAVTLELPNDGMADSAVRCTDCHETAKALSCNIFAMVVSVICHKPFYDHIMVCVK